MLSAKLATLNLAVTPPYRLLSVTPITLTPSHPLPRDGRYMPGFPNAGHFGSRPPNGCPGSLFYHTLCKRIRGIDPGRSFQAHARCFPTHSISKSAAFQNSPIIPLSLINRTACISYGRAGINPYRAVCVMECEHTKTRIRRGNQPLCISCFLENSALVNHSIASSRFGNNRTLHPRLMHAVS
jgi:hypothetical protein